MFEVGKRKQLVRLIFGNQTVPIEHQTHPFCLHIYIKTLFWPTFNMQRLPHTPHQMNYPSIPFYRTIVVSNLPFNHDFRDVKLFWETHSYFSSVGKLRAYPFGYGNSTVALVFQSPQDCENCRCGEFQFQERMAIAKRVTYPFSLMIRNISEETNPTDIFHNLCSRSGAREARICRSKTGLIFASIMNERFIPVLLDLENRNFFSEKPVHVIIPKNLVSIDHDSSSGASHKSPGHSNSAVTGSGTEMRSSKDDFHLKQKPRSQELEKRETPNDSEKKEIGSNSFRTKHVEEEKSGNFPEAKKDKRHDDRNQIETDVKGTSGENDKTSDSVPASTKHKTPETMNSSERFNVSEHLKPDENDVIMAFESDKRDENASKYSPPCIEAEETNKTELETQCGDHQSFPFIGLHRKLNDDRIRFDLIEGSTDGEKGSKSLIVELFEMVEIETLDEVKDMVSAFTAYCDVSEANFMEIIDTKSPNDATTVHMDCKDVKESSAEHESLCKKYVSKSNSMEIDGTETSEEVKGITSAITTNDASWNTDSTRKVQVDSSNIAETMQKYGSEENNPSAGHGSKRVEHLKKSDSMSDLMNDPDLREEREKEGDKMDTENTVELVEVEDLASAIIT